MTAFSSKGLTIWDLSTDQFDHSQLASNWTIIDGGLGKAQYAETLSTIPTTGNFAGRLVMLSTADGGFPAGTLIRYDGSAWRNAGSIEIFPVIPTLGNYAGRVIVLSADNGGFLAGDVLIYDGSAGKPLNGWKGVNTGILSTNIVGRETSGDVYLSDVNRGIVLIDRTGGTKRRVYINNGVLSSEIVT